MKENELLSVCVLLTIISSILIFGAWYKVGSYRKNTFECQSLCGTADSFRVGDVCYCAANPWTPDRVWGAHD